MSEQRKQTRIIHLAKDDYIKLINYGSITVDGKVIEYSDNDVHVTPSIIDESIIVLRHMTSEDGSYSVEYSEAGVEMHGFGTSTEYTSVGIFVDIASGGNKLLSFPSKSGTLATTDDCKSLYEHTITVKTANGLQLTFKITNSRPTMYASIDDLKSYITLPDMVKGVACVLYDINHSPSFNCGVIMSAIDGGSGTVAIQVISTYSESGSSLTGYNTFVSDTCIEL